MSKNTSFALGDHFSEFLRTQVSDGRYGSASEVVCAGLRMLEDHEQVLAVLRDALIEGESSGPSAAFDFDEFLERKRTASARR